MLETAFFVRQSVDLCRYKQISDIASRRLLTISIKYGKMHTANLERSLIYERKMDKRKGVGLLEAKTVDSRLQFRALADTRAVNVEG